MKTLTREQINEIIDLSIPKAKGICDNMYDEAVKTVGDNEHFKNLLDKSFDSNHMISVKTLRDNFNNYFDTFGDSIRIEDIYTFMKNIEDKRNSTFVLFSRQNGKMIRSMSILIDKSVELAFTNTLAEYMGVEL